MLPRNLRRSDTACRPGGDEFAPVPPDSTVVGVPGRVVKREGTCVKVDLRHDELPDPLRDAMMQLTNNISELDHRLERLEKLINENKEK